MYRGHARCDWPILPALFREKLEDTGQVCWTQLEAALILNFKQRSPGELGWEPHSELEWLATAQCYGLPTRLTSWSENGLVALFFATAATGDEADGAVWSLLPGDASLVVAQDYEQVPERARFYRPQHGDAARRNQRSWLLSHPLPERDLPPVSFDDYYRGSDERMHLCQIRIPHAAKAGIRRQLAMVGIDSRFLFPGLRGLCRHIQEEMYWHTDSYEWIFDASASQ